MKSILFRGLALVLFASLLLFIAWSPVHAEEMTCPDHMLVTIDIKPGSYPNSIQLASHGVVPVAVLTTSNFDANQFIPEMAHLYDATITASTSCRGAMAVRWTRDDVNGDGRADLVFFFKTEDLDFTPSSTTASLMAHGSYGTSSQHIKGTDSVRIRL